MQMLTALGFIAIAIMANTQQTPMEWDLADLVVGLCIIAAATIVIFMEDPRDA